MASSVAAAPILGLDTKDDRLINKVEALRWDDVKRLPCICLLLIIIENNVNRHVVSKRNYKSNFSV